MNILKNSWLRAGLAMIVLLLGVFFLAKAIDKEPIKEVEATKKLANQTWKFIGEEDDDPLNASFYELDAADAPCPGLPETVCKIEAPADPSNPNQPDMDANVVVSSTLTQKVHERISSALNALSIQTNETVTGLRAF